MSQAGTYDNGTILADIETLSGNSGGAVGPDGAGNVNIVGDGTEVTVTGNPGTNTLTITIADTIATSYPTDSGTAIPASNALTIAGGTGITTSGAGSTVTVTLDTPAFMWNEETGTSATMDVNNGYVANNAALVTLTLPDTAAFGSLIRVVGKGAGGWSIAQNAGESIIWDETSSTTVGVGGSLASSDDFDTVEILCTVANTTWTVLSSKGNITIV